MEKEGDIMLLRLSGGTQAYYKQLTPTSQPVFSNINVGNWVSIHEAKVHSWMT